MQQEPLQNTESPLFYNLSGTPTSSELSSELNRMRGQQSRLKKELDENRKVKEANGAELIKCMGRSGDCSELKYRVDQHVQDYYSVYSQLDAVTKQLTRIEKLYRNNTSSKKSFNVTGDIPVCAPYQELINGACVPKCPTGQERINGICVSQCAPYQERVNGVCVPKCAEGQSRNSSGICVQTLVCPTGQHKDTSGFCINDSAGCPTGQELVNGICVSQCAPYQERVNGVCVPKCGATGQVHVNGACICPTGQEVVNGKCVPKCTGGQTRNSSGVCVCYPYQELINGVCVPKCSVGQVRVNGVCKTPDPGNGCPTGYVKISGVCTKVDPTCTTGFSLVNGVCVKDLTCPDGQSLSNGVCIATGGQTLPSWAIWIGVAFVAGLIGLAIYKNRE